MSGNIVLNNRIFQELQIIKSASFRKFSHILSLLLIFSLTFSLLPSLAFAHFRHLSSDKSAVRYAPKIRSPMFAISSAIPPVQESLGVRRAASGSAAMNPAGTIKLHLNNVSVRLGWQRDEERGKRTGKG